MISVIAVITSPFYNGNMSNIKRKGDMWRYLHLLSVDPNSMSIGRIKNVASRLATRAHAFYSKKKWKQDLDYARENGHHDYYKAEGKGHYADHTLELIITDKCWSDV